jgi:hypothetical protein
MAIAREDRLKQRDETALFILYEELNVYVIIITLSAGC